MRSSVDSWLPQIPVRPAPVVLPASTVKVLAEVTATLEEQQRHDEWRRILNLGVIAGWHLLRSSVEYTYVETTHCIYVKPLFKKLEAWMGTKDQEAERERRLKVIEEYQQSLGPDRFQPGDRVVVLVIQDYSPDYAPIAAGTVGTIHARTGDSDRPYLVVIDGRESEPDACIYEEELAAEGAPAL